MERGEKKRKRKKEIERESIVQRLTPVHGVIPFFNHRHRPPPPPILPLTYRNPYYRFLHPFSSSYPPPTLHHHDHATRLSLSLFLLLLARPPDVATRCYRVNVEFSCICWLTGTISGEAPPRSSFGLSVHQTGNNLPDI